MRAYQFLQNLTKQFSYLDPQSEVELSNEAATAYMKEANAAKRLKDAHQEASEKFTNGVSKEDPGPFNPSLKTRIFLIAETWWFRYILAVLFIFTVPAIKAWINRSHEPDEDDDEDDDFEMFRLMRSMRKKGRD